MDGVKFPHLFLTYCFVVFREKLNIQKCFAYFVSFGFALGFVSV